MTLRSFPGSFDLTFEQCDSTKGHLISKSVFGIFNFSKKRPKKINLSTMLPQVEFFSFVFWKNWRHQKILLKLPDLKFMDGPLLKWLCYFLLIMISINEKYGLLRHCTSTLYHIHIPPIFRSYLIIANLDS